MTTTHTHTRTYTIVVPCNPYLVCDECKRRVEGFRQDDLTNHPCGHRSTYTNNCPSWGPVDGCSCQAHIGHTPHGEPQPPVTSFGREQGPA